MAERTKTVWPKLIVGHTYRYDFYCVDPGWRRLYEVGERIHGGTWTVEGHRQAGAFRSYVMRWTRHGVNRAVITDVTPCVP